MSLSSRNSWLIIVALCWALGCDSSPTETTMPGLESFIVNESLILNPTGYVPLAAELQLETSEPVQVELEILGLSNDLESLIHRFEKRATSFSLPVLGLFPAHRNTLLIRFYDAENQLLGEESRPIDTPQLLSELPEIQVRVNTERKKPGMNLVSFFGRSGSGLPQIPFMFDQHGNIRWYANMSTHPVLGSLFYDAGIERLKNGNLYFGDGSSGRIVEMDMLGRVVNEWPLPGYGYHHNVLELPNGNLLATVNKHGLATVEDHILEIHRETGDIVQEWDLRESLNRRRRVWSSNARDWFHGNGLAYDEAKDAIIVSGRVQGTVKLTRDNQVIWILAPHNNWGTAGDGTDLNSKLLQPLDSNGQPITDPAVLDGFIDHSEFSWAWYQHAPKLTPHGTLLVFDNGDNRHYQGQPVFSRAVEYLIDDDAMTVQQLWEYGRERGSTTYSAIVSDVDYHPEEDNVVFMPGANWEDGPNGKTIEVDYQTKDVVYEASIPNPEARYGITFHRIERLQIYPNNQ
ncbi:MAG: aryl-sulfate sulfotransferase [Rhodothermaceae bacterium]|nr:aryl-sulfate sulfotransferase [Rhodothermaceae bacterium]